MNQNDHTDVQEYTFENVTVSQVQITLYIPRYVKLSAYKRMKVRFEIKHKEAWKTNLPRPLN